MYVPNDVISVSSDALLSFNFSSTRLSAEELYVSGAINSVFPLGNTILRPALNIEDNYLFSEQENRLVLRPEMILDYSVPGIATRRRTRIEQSIGAYLDSKTETETGNGLRAEQVISLPLTELITFNNREFVKFSLGRNTSSARLSYSDFFRSLDTTIFNTVENYYPSYVIFNNSINFRAGKYLPTFGEMFILDKTDIFLFTDVFMNSILSGQSGKSLRASTGGGLTFNASLIGLRPWGVSLIGGYDFYRNNFFFSLNIN